MRLSEIHNTIPIIESVKTDFYDMYLLSSVQHNDDHDVQALLTDRVDKLIDHFKSQLYKGFLDLRAYGTPAHEAIKIDGVLDLPLENPFRHINNQQEMFSIIKNITKNEPWVLSGEWNQAAEIFFKLCNPPSNTKSKVMLLDKLFGLAHGGGSLTDYLDTPDFGDPLRHREWTESKTGWLFDALYIRALAHPNELAKHASHDARQAAKSADIGYGLGSSLSSHKPVTNADKLNLYRAKQERAEAPPLSPLVSRARPLYNKSPDWLLDDD